MARAFAALSGFPTFGKAVKNLSQSDYISRKNAAITFCNVPSYCNEITLANSYGQMNSYNLGAYANSIGKCKVLPVNKTNLVAGLNSKLNLKYLCTISVGPPPLQPFSSQSCNSDPVKIIPNNYTSTPFYYNNTIDPLGQEFGLTECGELNFTNYMEYYNPNSNSN